MAYDHLILAAFIATVVFITGCGSYDAPTEKAGARIDGAVVDRAGTIEVQTGGAAGRAGVPASSHPGWCTANVLSFAFTLPYPDVHDSKGEST